MKFNDTIVHQYRFSLEIIKLRLGLSTFDELIKTL